MKTNFYTSHSMKDVIDIAFLLYKRFPKNRYTLESYYDQFLKKRMYRICWVHIGT